MTQNSSNPPDYNLESPIECGTLRVTLNQGNEIRVPNGPVVSRYRREAQAWRALYEVEKERSSDQEEFTGSLYGKIEAQAYALHEAREFIRSLRWVFREKSQKELRAWLTTQDKIMEELCDGLYPSEFVPGYEEETDPDLNPDLLREG